MSSVQNPLFPVPRDLVAKKGLITNDYSISQRVLGVGINGKVLECTDRSSGNKYALKVNDPHKSSCLSCERRANACVAQDASEFNSCGINGIGELACCEVFRPVLFVAFANRY